MAESSITGAIVTAELMPAGEAAARRMIEGCAVDR
jgi:hypothetical protein